MLGARVITKTSLGGESVVATPSNLRLGTKVHEVWATAFIEPASGPLSAAVSAIVERIFGILTYLLGSVNN